MNTTTTSSKHTNSKPNTSKLHMITFLIVVLTNIPLLLAGDDDYTSFVYAGCSQPRYDPNSQYEFDVDSVLTSVANSAAYTSYSNFTSPSSSSSISALYQCRSDVPAAICASCVRSAISKLSSLCPSAAGAAVQLRACFVRYGNDSFLGKQDTTLLYKKCGGAAGNPTGADAVGMRDAALSGLFSAAGGDIYRVGGAGYVQAMSQCTGDLGSKACSDCVEAVAEQLKAGCGYATAGEVYLGKCYARFWTNDGGNGNGYGYGYGSSSTAAHGYNHGKQFLALVVSTTGGLLFYLMLCMAN